MQDSPLPTPTAPSFEFERSRGVVWVCDIAGSSHALNTDSAADAVEAFMPRFYWAARAMVEAAGGVFVKWTGDGFLAWFETPLHRDLGRRAWAVNQAAFHLTLLVNVTQLCVSSDRKFKLRHGVSFEQDALVTRITEASGYTQLDLTGRAVVLAFRMSGIEADFPSIVSQREIVEASEAYAAGPIAFVRWRPSADEKLRFFKGEAWGTSALYASGQRKPRRQSMRSVIRKAGEAIAAAEGQRPPKYSFTDAILRFDQMFRGGGAWCPEVLHAYDQFVREELLGSLKMAVSAMIDLQQSQNPAVHG